MGILFLLVLLLLAPNALAEKYNVLFIAIDDLNDYISPLDNHPGIQTPNFDRPLSSGRITAFTLVKRKTGRSSHCGIKPRVCRSSSTPQE
jgi:hypothetical protein